MQEQVQPTTVDVQQPVVPQPTYKDNLNNALEIFGKGIQTAAGAVGAFTILNSEAANLLKTLELLKGAFDLFGGSIKNMIDIHETQTPAK